MNGISLKTYQKVKNETVTCLSFENQSSQRGASYGGIDLITAVREVQKNTHYGRLSVILNKEQAEKVFKIELDRMAGANKRITFGEIQKIIREAEN